MCLCVCLHIQVQCHGLFLDPYSTSSCVSVCKHRRQLRLWNMLCEHMLSCIRLQLSRSRCVLNHRLALPCGFSFGGGAVEAKPWTRPSPSYTARNLLRQGEVSDLPHCSFFPRHSCGQLRAVDIHLLCFMIETQSNSTYTCS